MESEYTSFRASVTERPKVPDSRSVPVGVRRFESCHSHPPLETIYFGIELINDTRSSTFVYGFVRMERRFDPFP